MTKIPDELKTRDEVFDSPREEPSPGRVVSVDALRGLTIFLMVFVNDLGRAAPSWMHHIRPPSADGMTLADIVFPFFLFIVGVAIPLAFERAETIGISRWRQLGHILIRSASLLLLGVIEMNSDDDKTLGGELWASLAFGSILLAWCVIPRERGWKRTLTMILKAAGVAGLIGLLAIFRRPPTTAHLPILGEVSNWVWLKAGWWGILGLIGWSYLTVGVLTLVLGRRREWLMGSLALLMLLHLTVRNDGGIFGRLEQKAWLGPVMPVLRNVGDAINAVGSYCGLGDAVGSLAGISMAGCLLGSILRRDSDVSGTDARLRWAGVFAVGLFVAGLLTDTFEGINKIAATPTWCLWCAGLACTLWIALYALMDIAGWRAWSIVIRPAGANPLLAYFLHPIVTGVIGLAHLWGTLLAYKGSHDPWIVVAGSLGMALFVCALAGVLARLGLRLRL